MSIASALINNPPKEWTRRPEILVADTVPIPLHTTTPRTILGQEWWDKTRQEAYLSTDYHCIACGVHKLEAREHKWLEGHEVYNVDYPNGRATYVETVPLCHCCHCFIHIGRLQARVGKGLETKKKLNIVVRHGRKVLRNAKIGQRRRYKGKMPEWSLWRLVVFGEEYPPVIEDYEGWVSYHDNLT